MHLHNLNDVSFNAEPMMMEKVGQSKVSKDIPVTLHPFLILLIEYSSTFSL